MPPPAPLPPLHQKKNAWSQVRLTQIMHIVYFNKRSKVSATKESETGQNYFTDTQEFTIVTLLAHQGNQLNFET